MIVSEFLAALRGKGVVVTLDGQEVLVKGNRAALTPEIVTQLKENKPRIIAFLQELEGGKAVPGSLSAGERPDVIPLSLVQKSYWFLNQLEGGQSATYNMPVALRFRGEFQSSLVQKALQEILERHEALRTRFVLEGEVPVQQVRETFELDFSVIDVSERCPCEEERERVVSKLVEDEVRKAFDLEHDLLFRVKVFRMEPLHHIVVMTMHHIVSDGWSLTLLSNELIALYQGYIENRSVQLPDLALQYPDFALWQARTVSGDVYDNQLAYWAKKLEGLPPLLELPTDRPRPPKQSYRGEVLTFTIPAEQVNALTALARSESSTLFCLLVAALNVLLSRYANSEDIAIGTAIANRNHAELENLVGFFANTVVLRSHVAWQDTFATLLKQVTQTSLEAYAHPDVPFDDVVKIMRPERSLSIPPIFQVMFRLQNQSVETHLEGGRTQIEMYSVHTKTAKLDLNFSLMENRDGIQGSVEFATDLFVASSIRKMVGHYMQILNGIGDCLTTPVGRIPLITQKEIEQVQAWNATEFPYPENQCMHHLFEAQADKTPLKTAYVVGGKAFTYQALNELANQIAHFLQQAGVGPEVRVGVCVSRSHWMGACVLGVMKSHGTYIPLDPNYPVDRLAHMFDVSQPHIVLTEAQLSAHLPESGAKIVCLDHDDAQLLSQPRTNPVRLDHAEHSAYVLFTSGSTGKPKGILVAHRSFRNMYNMHQSMGVLGESARVLQFASLSFSISLWGSFMAWLGGGTLFQVTDDEALPQEPLFTLLRKEKINTVTWPVSLLSTFPEMDLPDLKTVISSAEPCTDAVVEKWGRDGRRFMNLYGNSEISIGSTLYEYKEKGQKLTIGKPFPNTQMYLLDHELQQVPEGVIAEIYTGGVGLARGYLNRPDATAEKFIPNPFTLVPGERLYRTGDLGRYLPNGEIEFLGREDFQVSIRGFRIELTEIEDVLRENEAIGEVAVVARPDPQGMDRLICYTVPREKGKELDVAMLRKILGDRLPNYMVPSLFVQLDSMPLTPNRKVDRLGLPEPDMTFLIEKRFVEPKTAEEKQLAQIWCDVMGLDRVGITNDFFEIGGHSLLATQIVSRINETLNRNVSIKAFFEHSTIEKLAHLISEGHQTQESGPIDILSDRQAVPLSFAQQRMWFLDQYEEHSTFYNMPGLYHLEGPLDQDALEMAFQRLIERHEVLRTNYVVLEGQPVQKIHPRMNWLLERNVLGGESEEEKRAELWKKVHEQMQHRFSLSEDRLMRAALYSFTVTHHYLFVTLHHILADGWSMKVMITDLAELYSAAVQKREANLPPLSVQYADYAAWQARILAEGRMEAQRHFWVRELHGTADIPLPIDFVRPEKQTFNGERLAIEFSSEMSERIAQLSRRYRTTPYITMLTAFAILLGRFCEHSDICLGTPIANRTRKELESLIGFFANTLVLRIRPETGMTFESVLEQVKKTAVDAYAHQDIPFDQVVEAVQPVRDASRNPLFQVFFSLNEWPQSSYEMEKVALKVVELEDKTAKFDLYLMVYTGPERMSGFFEYNTDLFRADTIRSLFSALNSVLEQIVDRPDGRIEALALSDGTAFASESEAKFSDYPVLEALYGPRLDSERFHFSVVDASMSPVPMGATGYVQLWGSVESDAILTSFKARMRNGKLYLIRSDEGVIWVDNQLLYPSEVEAFLLEQPTIADCHVILSQDNLGQAVLVAFLVLNTVSGRLDRVYLAEQIRARVKVAHLRVACVRIGHIPLAASGKVDETALLALPVLTETEIAAISDQARPLLQDQADLYVGFFPLSFQQSRIHLDELFGRQLDQGGLTVDGSIMERESVTDNATVFRKEALAYANGGELILPERAPRTLTEAFLAVARECPESGMSFYRPDGTLMFVSYPELLQRAQKIVAGLQARGFQPGEAAILQIDDLMHYFPVYWGCVLAGVRPVTVAVAHEYERGNNVVEKLHGIWSLLDKPPIIASTAVIKRVEQLFIRYPMEGGQVIDLATLSTHGISEAYYPATEDDIIFYQLSSGSTGVSKCIQERHGGIVRHIHAGAQYNGYGPKDVTLNWLPMDHVVPILTCHLKDTYWGCHQILVPTDAILGDPLVWLDLIDQCRVNYTWAPNFAFKLVSEAIRKHSDRQWDLSSIRFFMNAGEQVTMPVVREFLDMTSPFGVHQQTMQPAFGMAEVCTCMTYRNGFDVSTGARFFDKRTLSGYMQPVSVSDENAIGFIDLGGPVRGVEIRITDSENQPVAEGVIGRFQIRGGVVTPGYLRNEEANQEAFVGEGWFNSGDLGFIWEGHLFLTGREKEQIVVNGANFYCYEIEDVVNSVEGVKPTYSAACSVYDERTGTEKLAVFFVPANEDVTLNPQQIELIAAVRGQVTRNLGIFPQIVLPLTLSDFPKTTSGKIQRNTLRKGLLNGAFDRTLMDIDLQAGASNTLPLWFYRPNWVPKVIKRSGQLDRHGGILLFCESSDRAHHLVARLQSEKIALRLVRPNDNFSQHGGEYGIRPDRAEDYRQLKWHLEKEGFHCTHIVHDWSVRHGTSLNFELAQQEGLFSLLRILQTFQEAEHDTRLDVRVVTQYAYSIDQEDSVGYVNATLPGFAASVGSEAMGLGAAVIDIGEMNAQLAAEAIFQEICSIEMEDAVYRRGKRYVMRIQPCFTRETLLETPVQIQKNGRYVISGGLGGVSIELTRFLLTRFSARVLLLDCIDLENHPEKRILLKELASLSGQVVYENVDITCLERVESAVTRFSEQMGASVNGVFHLAGQYYERLFQDEAVDSLQEMLRAKCLGAIALDAVMAKQPPSDEAPLFFNMSSVLARFGGPGLGSYSSANSFLCSFTRHQNRSDRLGAAVRSTCFVSSNWNETGMRRDYKNKAVANDLGFLFMSPEHGVASMLAVIGQEHEEVWVGLNAHKPGVRPLCSEDLALDQVCVVTTGTVPLPPIDGQDALGKFYRTHCALVETIPLKRTGEVDLDTLQAQLTGQQRLRQTVVLPRNPLERDIADICTEVLHLDEISVKDNLFDLGGNSLLITKIHHQLQTRLGMRFPLVEMFNSPSVEKLAANLTFSNETGLPALVKISRETPVPMSYSQQRLWFIDKLGSDGALFAMPLVLRVVGELNRAALEETINRLVMRHETLRTTFSEREGELLQIIHENAPIQVPCHTVRSLVEGMGKEQADTALRKRVMDEIKLPFDLSQGPLIRLSVFELGNHEHVLVFNMHHIISDGWSLGIVAREFVRGYTALISRSSYTPEPLEKQYADYAVWQRAWLASPSGQAHLNYWIETLSGLPPVLELPLDFARPAQLSHLGEQINVRIDADLTRALEALAAHSNGTLFMVLMAAFNVVLYRWSGKKDLPVGSGIASRLHSELDSVIGFFADVWVLRTRINEEETFVELLERTRIAALEAYEHQSIPFDMIVDALHPERSLNYSPIYQVMFVLHNTPHAQLDVPGLKIEPVQFDTGTSKHDISVNLWPDGNELSGWIEYSTEVFQKETIQRLFDRYVALLGSVIETPNKGITQLELGDQEEMERLRHRMATPAEVLDEEALLSLSEDELSAMLEDFLEE